MSWEARIPGTARSWCLEGICPWRKRYLPRAHLGRTRVLERRRCHTLAAIREAASVEVFPVRLVGRVDVDEALQREHGEDGKARMVYTLGLLLATTSKPSSKVVPGRLGKCCVVQCTKSIRVFHCGSASYLCVVPRCHFLGLGCADGDEGRRLLVLQLSLGGRWSELGFGASLRVCHQFTASSTPLSSDKLYNLAIRHGLKPGEPSRHQGPLELGQHNDRRARDCTLWL